MGRRTLKDILYYPTPDEILDKLETSKGWPYKANIEFYKTRDKALVALLYLLALRVSEALRLERKQFKIPDKTGVKDRIIVRSIKLSKPRKKGTPRKHQFRDEGWLPLLGSRAPLSQLIVDYLQIMRSEKLFRFGRVRAWQIVTALVGDTCHWLRAYGEDFLYTQWDNDILAVADYIKVDARTLQEYIRRRYQKYPPR